VENALELLALQPPGWGGNLLRGLLSTIQIAVGACENLGFERMDIDGLWAGIYVIGFVQGAYSTEVIRGAMNAVSVQQVEAAKSVGMSSFLMYRRIIIPGTACGSWFQ